MGFGFNKPWVTHNPEADSCVIVFQKKTASELELPILYVEQATDAFGSSAKPLKLYSLYVRQGFLPTVTPEWWSYGEGGGAGVYTNGQSGREQCIWMGEIRPEDLDDGYSYFRARLLCPLESETSVRYSYLFQKNGLRITTS